MKCPFCEKDLPGVRCEACGEINPEQAKYCMMCGELLEAITSDGSVSDEYDLDFENRVLCPDGNCTGIIVDGKCTECGRPYNPSSPTEEEETED